MTKVRYDLCVASAAWILKQVVAVAERRYELVSRVPKLSWHGRGWREAQKEVQIVEKQAIEDSYVCRYGALDCLLS